MTEPRPVRVALFVATLTAALAFPPGLDAAGPVDPDAPSCEPERRALEIERMGRARSLEKAVELATHRTVWEAKEGALRYWTKRRAAWQEGLTRAYAKLVPAQEEPADGFAQSLSLTLPPLSVVVMKKRNTVKED